MVAPDRATPRARPPDAPQLVSTSDRKAGKIGNTGGASGKRSASAVATAAPARPSPAARTRWRPAIQLPPVVPEHGADPRGPGHVRADRHVPLVHLGQHPPGAQPGPQQLGVGEPPVQPLGLVQVGPDGGDLVAPRHQHRLGHARRQRETGLAAREGHPEVGGVEHDVPETPPFEVDEPDTVAGHQVVVRAGVGRAEGAIAGAAEQPSGAVRLHLAGRGHLDPELLAQQLGQTGQSGPGVVGERVPPGPLALATQQRAEVALPAGGGGLHPAQRPGPAEQATASGDGSGPEQLVGEGGAAAQVLQHQQPALLVVGDEHRAGTGVGGQGGEQLAAGHLVVERVGSSRVRGAQVVLDDHGSRQRERVVGHPGPGDHRAVAAPEVLRIGQYDLGAGASAEQSLGRGQRSKHRPGECAQVVNHCSRGYPRRRHRLISAGFPAALRDPSWRSRGSSPGADGPERVHPRPAERPPRPPGAARR